MADILKLEDYRRPSPGGALEVTFFAPLFKDENGSDQRVVYQVTLAPDVSLGELLDGIRETGALFMDGGDRADSWVMPWPCAAVRVRLVSPGGAR